MEILLREEEIRERIRALGREISSFYQGEPLTLIALGHGALFFCCDLSREITTEHWFDTIEISTCLGERNVFAPSFRTSPKLDVKGRHLLLVDDIFDTGATIDFSRRNLADSGALSVRSAVLLEKELPLQRPASPDWVGFHVPDHFLVGWGMDSDENYRNLRFIGFL